MNTKSEGPGDPHNFRENMKKWRKIRGMSQEDLARKVTENPPENLSFHQQTIQKIENGNRGVSLTDAVLISVALRVDLNTLLTAPEGPDKTLDEREKDRLRRDMHIAHLAVKQLESTLERLEKTFDIAPGEEQRESVAKEIEEGPQKKPEKNPDAFVVRTYGEGTLEEIGELEDDHGVDN